MTQGILALVLVLSLATAARAQTAAVEVTQSVGLSSEWIKAGGVQARLIAEPLENLRLKVETTWGDRTRRPWSSDVFGTAYPYDNTVRVMEAYGEWLSPERRGLRAIKVGRYRTPFGLSQASDHAYIGFLRPPLIRYERYWALSGGYLEHGVDVVMGTPRFNVEASVGRPADVGTAVRRSGMTGVLRVQGVAGPLTIGASFIDTTPYLPRTVAAGRSRFGGLDARWMLGGVQLRGEWMGGRFSSTATTSGGYLDAIVHRPFMGPFTALGRIEHFNYVAASPHALRTNRYSAGLRLRLWQYFGASFGVTHQRGHLTMREPTAYEGGLTFSLRKDLIRRK